MHSFLSKPLFLMTSFLVMIISSSHAENQNETLIHQGYPIKKGKIPSGYNAFAKIKPVGVWNFSLSGSFLYYLVKEGGTECATSFNTTDPRHMSFAWLDTDYKPGFKVSMGVNCKEHDHWGIETCYTRIHLSHKGTESITNTSEETLSPTWITEENLAENTATKGVGKWNLNLDLLDLSLSRSFYLGTHLIFHPLFGLRGGFLGQAYEAHYTIAELSHLLDTDAASFNKQKTWVIGPLVGIEGKWILDAGFRIFGNISSSLLYQKFHNSFAEEDIASFLVFSSSNHSSTKESTTKLTPNIDLSLGLGYGTYFLQKKWHLDLSIGYQFQFFWEQNMMRFLKDQINDSFEKGNVLYDIANLSLHGLIITTTFDF